MLLTNAVYENLFNVCLLFPEQQKLLRKEHRNGHYCLSSWFGAYCGSIILLQIIHCGMLSTPLYILVGLSLELGRVLVFLLCLFLVSCIGCVLGVIFGAVSGSDELAVNRNVMLFTVPFFLFGGFAIPRPSIPWYFLPLYNFNIFRIALAILRVNEFQGAHFADCQGSHDVPISVCTGDKYLSMADIDSDPVVRPIWLGFMQLGASFFFLIVVSWFCLRKTVQCKTG